MLKKIIIIIFIGILALNYVAHGTDLRQEHAAFQYIKNSAEKKSMIFEDTYYLDAIEKRIKDANAWVQTLLKKNSDSTLEKAFVRISHHARNMYNNLVLISNNLTSITTEASSLNRFRKLALQFSQDRDALKKELEPKSKLNGLKKRRFPPLNNAKKEIIDELLVYAETFITLAQKAITDFAQLDGNLFLQETNMKIEEANKKKREANKPLQQKKLAELYEEYDVTGLSDESYDPLILPPLRDLPGKKQSNLLNDTALDELRLRDLERDASEKPYNWNAPY